MLFRTCENIGALCHKVDATENYIFAIATICGRAGQFKRVTGDICKLNNFISLVMMAKD
jgi:hypothetical protein